MARSLKQTGASSAAETVLAAVARLVTALEGAGRTEQESFASLDEAARRLAAIADASGLPPEGAAADLPALVAALDRHGDASLCDAVLARHEAVELPDTIADGVASIAESVHADVVAAGSEVRLAAIHLSSGPALRDIASQGSRATAPAATTDVGEEAAVRGLAAVDAFIARLDELAAHHDPAAPGAAYLAGALRAERGTYATASTGGGA